MLDLNAYILSFGDRDDTNKSLHKHQYKNLLLTLGVSAPIILAAYYTMGHQIDWWSPSTLLKAVLVFTCFGFVIISTLESVRTSLNKLTLPTLLLSFGFILLLVAFKALESDFPAISFKWILPAIGGLICFTPISVFTEKNKLIKLYLGLNGLSLVLLWGLGEANKIYLPSF